MANIRNPYDLVTWLKYKVFHRPLRLRVTANLKIGQPKLTVVFLHGIAATSDVWQKVIRQMARQHELDDIRLISMDLLGFGKSPHANWFNYDYTEYNQALQNTLEKLHITTPLVLAGHSMGGLIAANYAVHQLDRFDLKELILVSPPVLMPNELAKLPDRVYTRSYASLHRLAEDEPAIEVIARFIQRFSSFRSNYLKTTAFARSIDNIILNRHNYQTFTKIRTPTLIIHGRFDPLVIGANLARATRNNAKYLTMTNVLAHHDITSNKRVKIVNLLNQLSQEIDKENQDETL